VVKHCNTQVSLDGFWLWIFNSQIIFQLLWLLCYCVCLTVNLMGLLKWRENPKDLERYLHLFMKVDGEEIVKVRELFFVFRHVHVLCCMFLLTGVIWTNFRTTYRGVKCIYICSLTGFYRTQCRALAISNSADRKLAAAHHRPQRQGNEWRSPLELDDKGKRGFV